MGDELPDAVLETVVDRVPGAFVPEADREAAVQVGELAEPVVQHIVVELDGLEDRPVGLERDPGSLEPLVVEPLPGLGAVTLLTAQVLLMLGLRAAFERLCDQALPELHLVDVAVPENRRIEPACKGVDDRDTDAVQPAGDLVSIFIELSAGVEHGEDDLKSALAVLGHDIDRDTAAVVLHRDRAVLVDAHLYQVAEPG
jgi:hypothetical protein